MPKNLVKLACAIALIFCFGLKAEATKGHSITKLKLKTSPVTPRVGSTLNSLTLNFNLTAKSGIDSSRIQILQNNGNVTNSGDLTVTENTETEVPNTKAQVKFVIEGLTIQRADNKFTVSYCLTSSNCNTKLASNSISFQALSSSGNNGNTPPPNTGNGNNGTPAVAPIIFFMDVEELTESNGDLGNVSLNEKQFRLTINHNGQYLDQVTNGNFNAVTNPILRSLSILSTNTYTRGKTNVTDDYTFNLEAASVKPTTGNTSLFKTTYITDPVIIKTGQRLTFKVNLLKNYFKKFDIPVPQNSIVIRQESIDIEPIQGAVLSMSLTDPISFSNIGKKRGKVSYLSDNLNFNIETDAADGVSAVSKVNFFVLNNKKKKVKPRLAINSKARLAIAPSLTSNGSVAGSTVTLPITLRTAAKEKFIIKKGFNDSGKEKILSIPFILNTVNTDGLDLVYKATFDDAVNTEFEITTTTSNGDSL